MNRPRMLLVGAVAVILLALLAACGGDDDDPTTTTSAGQGTEAAAVVTDEPEPESTEDEAASGSDEPTATTAEDEPTATVAGEDPTATDEPEATAAPDDSDDPTATATEAESDGDAVLVGSASVDDETKDVSNILMQEPDEPMPGIDLVNVRLEGDGEQIVVTIQTAGDIAAELSDDVEVSFDVHLWQDSRPAYALSFHKDGNDDWEASVTDFSVGLGDEETVETEISLSGNTLSAAFPASMLPEIEAEFEWYSSVIRSEGGMMIGPESWFDGAPDNVIALLADPDEFVEFPQ